MTIDTELLTETQAREWPAADASRELRPDRKPQVKADSNQHRCPVMGILTWNAYPGQPPPTELTQQRRAGRSWSPGTS